MLDKVDLRLINLLYENGRINVNDISKRLDISVPTATKRLQYLLNENIVNILAIPNPFKLRYTAHALINIRTSKPDKVGQRFSQNFNVSLVRTNLSRYNLTISMSYPTLNELKSMIASEVINSGDIDDVETFFIEDIKKRCDDLFSDDQSTRTVLPELKDIDHKLMHELSVNGRLTGVYLAKKLNVDKAIISRRLNYLLKEDIIQVRAIANLTRLGPFSNASVFFKTDTSKTEKVCEKLSKLQQVVSLYTLMNRYNVCATIVAKNNDSISDFIKKHIMSLSTGSDMEILVRGDAIKLYYGPLPLMLRLFILPLQSTSISH